MRRVTLAAALAAALILPGCGHTNQPSNKILPPSVKQACPDATHLQGSMGACSPEQQATAPAGAIVASAALSIRGSFPDFSNNDPCYCGAQLRAHGHPGEIDKVNQGVGFIDRTFGPMVADARRHGLCVGGYDFDQDYTAAEAYTLVAGLHHAGIYRHTTCTFPPTLDVEFGLPSKAGLEHQLAVLRREYGRAQIYTGGWYWTPHFGCWVPKGVRDGWVKFWLSGYPTTSLPCGVPARSWKSHQYTDHGYTGAPQVPYSDMSRYLAGDFASFVQLAKPKPTKAQLRAQLHHLYRERTGVKGRIAALSALLTRHGCRPPHHATPRSYHWRACPAWKREGDASHTHLAQIEAAIRALHAKGA